MDHVPFSRPPDLDEDHLREPSRYRAKATLRDGTGVVIRAIRPGDHDAEAAFVAGLSNESRYFRFFQAKRGLSEAEILYFTKVDFVNHVGLVATRSDGATEPILAVGRYVATKDLPPNRAEVAVAVDDAIHGQGIATLLLQHLAGIARAHGISEFQASVLSENRSMLDVFAHSGFPVRRGTEAGVTSLVLSLAG